MENSKDYVDKAVFRLLRVAGPYSKEVNACAKPTFMLQDTLASKFNYYCYDPLTSKFLCATVYKSFEN